jgi:hypothetical protein
MDRKLNFEAHRNGDRPDAREHSFTHIISIKMFTKFIFTDRRF